MAVNLDQLPLAFTNREQAIAGMVHQRVARGRRVRPTRPHRGLIDAVFGLLFAIASVTLAEGAKRVPSGQTALISALETPLAPLLAFIIFLEVPTAATVIGGAAVLFGVLLSIRVERPLSAVAKQKGSDR